MPDRSKWDKKYLYIGLTAFGVIAASITFFIILSNIPSLNGILGKIIRALSPIIWGIVIAYLLNTPMKLFERIAFSKLAVRLCPKGSERKRKRVARILSAAVVLLLAVGAITGIVALVIPQVIDSVSSIVTNIQTYVNEAVDFVNRFARDNPEIRSAAESVVGNVGAFVRNWANENILQKADLILANLTGGISNAVRGVINGIIGLVVSFYLLYHKETFGAQCKKTLYGIFKPRRANALVRVAAFVDKTCGGFLAGKILDSLIVGVICYISMLILRMPYPALIAMVVGITNIIPFFGPFIGAIPCAVILLFVSPVKCLIFVAYIIILQQIDGNIIGPRILGGSVGLSGFWILFSLLFFGGLFGFWGMLLGVPVFSVIYEGLRRLVAFLLRRRAAGCAGLRGELHLPDQPGGKPAEKKLCAFGVR